jgi:hypothetical protein
MPGMIRPVSLMVTPPFFSALKHITQLVRPDGSAKSRSEKRCDNPSEKSRDRGQGYGLMADVGDPDLVPKIPHDNCLQCRCTLSILVPVNF